MTWLAQDIIELLKKLNLSLSSCESVTGGHFISSLISVPDASKVIKGSIVAYTNETKMHVVKVRNSTLEQHGSISKEVALEMSLNVKKLLNTDIGISITGNAGPNNIENKKAGLAYMSISFFEKSYWFLLEAKPASRNMIRDELVYLMLNQLKNFLINLKP